MHLFSVGLHAAAVAVAIEKAINVSGGFSAERSRQVLCLQFDINGNVSIKAVQHDPAFQDAHVTVLAGSLS
jgi:hypothetical protein